VVWLLIVLLVLMDCVNDDVEDQHSPFVVKRAMHIKNARTTSMTVFNRIPVDGDTGR